MTLEFEGEKVEVVGWVGEGMKERGELAVGSAEAVDGFEVKFVVYGKVDLVWELQESRHGGGWTSGGVVVSKSGGWFVVAAWAGIGRTDSDQLSEMGDKIRLQSDIMLHQGCGLSAPLNCNHL